MVAGRAKLDRLLERPRPGTRSHRLKPLVVPLCAAVVLRRAAVGKMEKYDHRRPVTPPPRQRAHASTLDQAWSVLHLQAAAQCKFIIHQMAWRSRPQLIAAHAAAPAAAPGELPPSCSHGSLHARLRRLAVPPFLLLPLLLQVQLRQPLPLTQPARLPLLRRRLAVPASAAAAPAAAGVEPRPAFSSPLASLAACAAAAPFPQQPALQ